MNFYELTPLDTLFFRGAEPLEPGQLVTSAFFPPPVSVISGAIRTTVLKENGISFNDYNKGENVPDQILRLIGNSSEQNLPFIITAILLKRKNSVYSPAPYSWFIDKAAGKNYSGLKVIHVKIIDPNVIKRLSIHPSSRTLPVAISENEVISIGGKWIRSELLSKSGEIVLAEDDLLDTEQLYATESRTGISLLDEVTNRPTRNVQKGALFTARHIRLKDDVTLIIATDKDCGLKDFGKMQLGGEQRLCGYKKISPLNLGTSGNMYVALSPVRAEKNIEEQVFCTGKLMTIAGWDMRVRFHKPSQSWFPAGTVFKENINNQCVPISQ
jgi:CRISPR-associated protein Cmr3